MNNTLSYQDPVWEELIDGKLIAMSPRPSVPHNYICGNIFWIFKTYLHGKRCTPFADGTDLYLSEKEQYIPDGMIVCDPDKIQTDGVHGAPDLVVEVLSPSTAKYDRGHKKDVYEAHGVREYWIVNPADLIVEQYFLENGRFVLNETYAIFPDYLLEKMKPEERAAVMTEFKCSLYDDLTIRLEDIFYLVTRT